MHKSITSSNCNSSEIWPNSDAISVQFSKLHHVMIKNTSDRDVTKPMISAGTLPSLASTIADVIIRCRQRFECSASFPPFSNKPLADRNASEQIYERILRVSRNDKGKNNTSKYSHLLPVEGYLASIQI